MHPVKLFLNRKSKKKDIKKAFLKTLGFAETKQKVFISHVNLWTFALTFDSQ